MVFKASSLLSRWTVGGGRGVENWRWELWRWKIRAKLTYMLPEPCTKALLGTMMLWMPWHRVSWVRCHGMMLSMVGVNAFLLTWYRLCHSSKKKDNIEVAVLRKSFIHNFITVFDNKKIRSSDKYLIKAFWEAGKNWLVAKPQAYVHITNWLVP